MQLKTIVGSLALLGLASHALAQTTPAAPQKITITGSSIKRIASETSLPIQTITRAELDRQGIISAEQLIQVRRPEDQGNALWLSFQRIQGIPKRIRCSWYLYLIW